MRTFKGTLRAVSAGQPLPASKSSVTWGPGQHRAHRGLCGSPHSPCSDGWSVSVLPVLTLVVAVYLHSLPDVSLTLSKRVPSTQRPRMDAFVTAWLPAPTVMGTRVTCPGPHGQSSGSRHRVEKAVGRACRGTPLPRSPQARHLPTDTRSIPDAGQGPHRPGAVGHSLRAGRAAGRTLCADASPCVKWGHTPWGLSWEGRGCSWSS